MKLDRNLNANGRGKYALLKLRKLDETTKRFGELGKSILDAVRLLEREGILDWGSTVDSEFMVIRLKDRYARGALQAYADAARTLGGDLEYAAEIEEMAARSGPNHPNCKDPD